MLSPENYDIYSDEIIELYSQLDESITRDIARRIVKNGKVTPGAKWQIQVEQEAGLLYDDIVSKVAEYAETSKTAVQSIFEDAGIKSTDFDNKIYEAAGKNPQPLLLSESLMKALNAGIVKTNGNISNLTKTTALSAQSSFINACAIAEMEISSGAFDYNTAIRHAVENVAKQSNKIIYPSGTTRSIESAVRTAVMTGVSQTTGEISIANAKELDTDLMELSAHYGARPTHAEWQGQIVSLSGRKGYLSLDDIGYGAVDGFKGINCYHDWYPYIEGISTRAWSDKSLENAKDKTVSYNGKEMTLYEAEQQQRAMERKIRDKRRELAGYDEAIKATEDEKLRTDLSTSFYDSTQKLKKYENLYKDFSSSVGLITQKERLQTNGFNRSVSRKAVNVSKNLQFIKNDAIIKKQSNLPKRLDLPDEKLKHTINVSFAKTKKIPSIEAVVPKGTTMTNVYVMAGDGTSVPIRDLKRLYTIYKYPAEGWQKKSGDVTGENFKYVIHWYEYKGFIPIEEMKLKGVGKN